MATQWTGPMEKKAVVLYKKGGSRLVEKEMNIKQANVRHKMHTLGIKTSHRIEQRGFYAEDIAAMFEFRSAGMSYAAIAMGFKSTANSIQSMLTAARKNGFDSFPLRNK